MSVDLLTEKELADRWKVSERTVQRMREDESGPRFVMIRSKVRYKINDVLHFEEQKLSKEKNTD